MLWLKLKRLWYRRQLLRNDLALLLLACWQAPLPARAQLCEQSDFLVVDLETSSLDAESGEIISIGWVAIRQGTIQLSSAEHCFLKSENSVGHSATIHHIRDCELETGRSLLDVAQRFLEVAEGKVLVFHHAPLDMAFLNKASQRLFSVPLLLPVVDTLEIEKRSLLRRQEYIKKGELRLGACRQRYNLPTYPAHDALLDALSTAELLLAQLSQKGKNVLLSDIV